MLTRAYLITGLVPLLMHNTTALNSFHPLAKEMKKMTGKRTKTDDDHERIAELEFAAGLYHDDKIGPYVSGLAIDRCLQEAAKLSKRGKDVQRGLSCVEMKVPLKYAGPREADELFADKNFVDIRSVGVMGRRVNRCRPRFNDWSFEAQVLLQPDIWNPEDVDRLFETAGRLIGLLDFRPRFGRFEAVPV